MAVILVLGVKVPFTGGGQEVLVKSLVRELRARNHEVDVLELPYNPRSREAVLHYAALWRAIDIEEFYGKSVDLAIATKFPSYYAKHPRKSLWLVHQHRPVYDLFGTKYSDFSDDPRDESIRRMVVEGDRRAISECAFVSGISRNVVQRLHHFNGITGMPLYPPLPLGDQYRTEEPEPYILSVGRICSIKRVDLIVKALPSIHDHVKLKVVGMPDEVGVLEYLRNEVAKHHLGHRVEFLGRVDDETLVTLYSKALAVYYAPHDEDYGYVTLEAFASGKPVVTADDSGGVLEFVRDGENGLVVSPEVHGVAAAFNRLVSDEDLRLRLGRRGKELVEEWGLARGWDPVISNLLSPLEGE